MFDAGGEDDDRRNALANQRLQPKPLFEGIGPSIGHSRSRDTLPGRGGPYIFAAASFKIHCRASAPPAAS